MSTMGVYIYNGLTLSTAMNPEAKPNETLCVVNGSPTSFTDDHGLQTINIFPTSQNEDDIVKLKMKNRLCLEGDFSEQSCKDQCQTNVPSQGWLKATLESAHSLPNLSIGNFANEIEGNASVETSRNSCTDIGSEEKSLSVTSLGGAESTSTSSSSAIQHLLVEKNGLKLNGSRESDVGTDTENEELQNLLVSSHGAKSPVLVNSKNRAKGKQEVVIEDNITICVNNNNSRLSKVLENIPLLYIPHTKQLVSRPNKQSESHHSSMENFGNGTPSSLVSKPDQSPAQSPLVSSDRHSLDPTHMSTFSGSFSDIASVSSSVEISAQDRRERTLSNPESDNSSGSTGNVLSQDSDVSCASASTVTDVQSESRQQSQLLKVDNFDVISIDSLSKMSLDRESPHSSLNRTNTVGSFNKNLTDASSFSSVSSISTSTDFSMSATSCSEDFPDLKGFIMDVDDAGFMEVNLHSRNSFERSRNSSQDSGIDEKHGHHGAKPKRRTISGFFSRNLFSKKTKESECSSSAPGWKLFGRIPPKEGAAKDASLITAEYQAKTQHHGSVETSAGCNEDGKRRQTKKHQDVEVTSTTGLILETRPQGLPSKTPEEEERHRQEYEAMIEAAKKREMKEARLKRKHQQQQIRHESFLATAIQIWNTEILPNWDNMKNSKKARELWWMGIPPSVRGRVWELAIGNELNLTSELYEICLTRAKDRIKMMLESADTEDNESSPNREASVDLIKLDVSRTFPQLCIFQKGGPYHDFLQSLLGAYACYRPDVGYVQGMSFIAAFLLLNMDVDQAFICFANLLNKPCQVAFFRMDESLIKSYFVTYEEFLKENLPQLYEHFSCQNLTPDLYIIDWMFTLFSKSLPLDIACRVWDVFCRDGEEFLFRTALGILKLYEEVLMNMDFIHLAQFLTKLPETISTEHLFHCIDSVKMMIDKRRFVQVLADNKDIKCDT